MNLKKIFHFVLLITFSISGFSQITSNSSNTSADSINNAKPAPAVFMNDTLFVLSHYSGAFSPKERVKAIENKLNKIAENYTDVKDSFNIVKTGNGYLIKFKNSAIMSVNDEDAKPFGISTKILAERYKNEIQKVFFENIDIQSKQSLIIKIGLTLLTLAGLILLFYLVIKLFKWIDNKIEAYEKKINRKRKSIFRYLMPKGKQDVFLLITSIIKYFLFFLILVLYLPLLFRYIPWSKGIVNEFYGYILEPVKFVLQGFLNFLPNLFYIIIIFLIARYLIRVLTTIEEEYENDKIKIKGFHKDWAKPTLTIFKVIIYAFAIIFMFPYIPGSKSDAFKGVSIFFGVLLSLGSTSAISNIIAGVVITYMRPFMIGDRVKIGETIGDVVEKSMLVTKIRTIKNEDVTIPNATIINTHLWNYSRNAKDIGIILHTTVTIGYDVPWDKVNKLLIKAGKQTKLIQRTPPPFVLQKSLNDNYIEYELNVYSKQPKKMQEIYSDLHRNILDVFNAAGIEILSPRYVASRDGNSSTVVPVNEPKPAKNPVNEIIDTVTGKNQKPITTSSKKEEQEKIETTTKDSSKREANTKRTAKQSVNKKSSTKTSKKDSPESQK